MSPLLTRDEARALSDRVLAQVTAGGAELTLDARRHAHTRYAANQIATSGEVSDLRAEVTVRVGRRRASVRFNRFGEQAVADAVATAERLAGLAPEDPELMPLLGPQEYGESAAYFPTTADLDAEALVEAVRAAVAPAAAQGLVATGFIERRARATAAANTAGLFAYHRETLASHTTTVRTPEGDGSGWAGTTHNDWGQMTPPALLAEQAAARAARSRGAAPLAPGPHTVVLEPTAVGHLVQLLGSQLDQRAAEEGRSFFAAPGGGTKLGTQVLASAVTLESDPFDPDVRGRPFTEEGLPIGRTMWIEAGVVRRLAVSRYWAARTERQPRPYPGFLKLAGGAGSVDDLVQTVERGVLVTRFWYVRGTDPRTVSYTGLTRDGTFLIEGGRITTPVKNMRFNHSVVALLQGVQALGAAQRVVASESGGLGAPIVVPPLVAREFRFTSVSDAV